MTLFPKSMLLFSLVETSEEWEKSSLTTGNTSFHTSVTHRDTKKDVTDLSRFKSLYKVLRILAYARRYNDKLTKNVVVLRSYITAARLSESIIVLIRQEQKKPFSEEILETLESAQQVKPKSQICELYPFLDNGVLCFVGRSVHATSQRKQVSKTNSLEQAPRTSGCIDFSPADTSWWE